MDVNFDYNFSVQMWWSSKAGLGLSELPPLMAQANLEMIMPNLAGDENEVRPRPAPNASPHLLQPLVYSRLFRRGHYVASGTVHNERQRLGFVACPRNDMTQESTDICDHAQVLCVVCSAAKL